VQTYVQAGLEALGDPTRFAILQSLARRPLAVSELAQTLPVSRPAVSQHLRVLKDARLVSNRKAGTKRIYEVNPEGIALLREHLDKLWEQALSTFQAVAEKTHEEKRHGRTHGSKGKRSPKNAKH
jgi:DNA-binding transcriptional ArsR family regulator